MSQRKGRTLTIRLGAHARQGGAPAACVATLTTALNALLHNEPGPHSSEELYQLVLHACDLGLAPQLYSAVVLELETFTAETLVEVFSHGTREHLEFLSRYTPAVLGGLLFTGAVACSVLGQGVAIILQSTTVGSTNLSVSGSQLRACEHRWKGTLPSRRTAHCAQAYDHTWVAC